ncbi:MAG TPA: hypothetical protein VHP13_07890 [Gammaproteobacteria bacterium]|jgi:hypothetical protein|nr:hypothetical protein [Gammaproteobacteria bacterium]
MKPRHAMAVKAAGLGLALTACSVAPIQEDGPVRLVPGQGLAAVTFDTLDSLSEVLIDGHDGKRLHIPSVPVGRNIYLFAVPAGEYCFVRFQYAHIAFVGKRGHLACFDVYAGELSYSGTLAPRTEGDEIVNRQVQDPAGFRTLLAQQYPQVSAEFPPQPDQP